MRLLDAHEAPHRRAEAAALRGLVEATAASDLAEAVARGRRHLAEVRSRLPDLVAEANRAASQLKFP